MCIRDRGEEEDTEGAESTDESGNDSGEGKSDDEGSKQENK